MANNEDYLDALTAYSKKPSSEIPRILEQYLKGVAKNGETLFPWQLMKPLIVSKIDQVTGELKQRLKSEHIPERPNVENVRFDVMCTRIMDQVQRFNGAPFTIQRVCELLVDPKRHYKRSDKFMRGLEKNILVVSTVDPFGRKVVSESNSDHLVNGVDANGSPFFPRDSNITANLPPVPDWITTAVASKKHTKGGSDADSLGPKLTKQVTMDTNEASTLSTGGGEAMAEECADDKMIGENTNSSIPSHEKCSSAYDSSEGLSSTADISAAVTSLTEAQAKSWTSSDSVKETLKDINSRDIDYSSNSAEQKTVFSGDSPNRQKDSLLELNSFIDSSEREDQIDTSTESSSEQNSSNNACESNISASTSLETKASSQCYGSESGKLDNITTSDVKNFNKSKDSNELILSPELRNINCSNETAHLPQLSSSTVNSDVIISSSTDSVASNVTPLNPAKECVEDADRLVSSVEPHASSQDTSQTLPTVTCQSHLLPTAFNSEKSLVTCITQSSETSVSSASVSVTEAASSEAVPVSLDICAGSDTVADTTSPSINKIPVGISLSQNQNPEAINSLTTASTNSDVEKVALPPSPGLSFTACQEQLIEESKPERKAEVEKCAQEFEMMEEFINESSETKIRVEQCAPESDVKTELMDESERKSEVEQCTSESETTEELMEQE